AQTEREVRRAGLLSGARAHRETRTASLGRRAIGRALRALPRTLEDASESERGGYSPGREIPSEPCGNRAPCCIKARSLSSPAERPPAQVTSASLFTIGAVLSSQPLPFEEVPR